MVSAKVKNLIKDINKKHGVNAIILGGEMPKWTAERISTPSLELNEAINGGISIGRFIQIRGHYSSFKSTIGYMMIAESIKDIKRRKLKDKYCLIISGESESYTDEYAESLGIDLDYVIVNPSSSLEEAYDIALSLGREGIIYSVLIDSVASLSNEVELSKNLSESKQMGVSAKINGEFTRKLQGLNNKLSREGDIPITYFVINQIREKIGVMFGNPEFSPGGKALDYTSSLNIDLRKGDAIREGKDKSSPIVGWNIKFKIPKSKISTPFKEGSFDIYLKDIEEKGIKKGHVDRLKEIIYYGINFDVINKSGNWLTYKDIKVNGMDLFLTQLRSNTEYVQEIEEIVINRINNSVDKEYEVIESEDIDSYEETAFAFSDEELAEEKVEPKKVKRKLRTRKKVIK